MEPQVNATPVQPQETFSFGDPYLWLGAFMFFLNSFADRSVGLPIGDLIFPLFAYALASKHNMINRIIQCPGAVLAILLMCMITLSNVYHDVPAAKQIRLDYAIFTLFLPIFFFILSENRKALVSYVIGSTLAFGVYFVFISGLSILQHGTILRELRGLQPTPAVGLAIYFLLRDQLSKGIRWFLLAPMIFSLLAAFIIQARGPLMSLIIAGGLLILIRFAKRPALAVAIALLCALLFHFIWGIFVGSAYDVVAQNPAASVSNLQRAFAIDYCRMVLAEHPWLGASPLYYAIDFADNFLRVAGWVQAGDRIESPHNSFLEYSVFYGYPAGFLFILAITRIVYGGLTTGNLARTLGAALVVGAVIRMGAFYGFSGGWRGEWFAVILPLYYTYRQKISLELRRPV